LKIVDGKDTYGNTFDKRGNLVQSVYYKNKNSSYVVESYIYDATNRMVKGTNETGESSFYIYNGLGHLVGNEWIIKKNGYGYTGLSTTPSEQFNGVIVCNKHSHTDGSGHINPTGQGHTGTGTSAGMTPNIDSKKFSVIHKDYVLDYTSPLKNVIMETEEVAGGLTYRYTYGLKKVNVVIKGIPNGVGGVAQKVTYPDGPADIVKLYYHHDRLGSTIYLTDNVAGKVTSYVSYDDWGALTNKAIVRIGVRELDLVQEYTGHPEDMVLGIYYARARMYDAQDNRFTSFDKIRGFIKYPLSQNKYLYTESNPIKYIDITLQTYEDKLFGTKKAS